MRFFSSRRTPALVALTAVCWLAISSVALFTSAAPASAATVKTTGTRSVLVILMDWTAPDSVTPDSAKQIIGTDDNQFYDEASFGQLQWAPTVTQWLSVPAPTGVCGSQLIPEGETAAEQAGYDPASYDNVMVYIPRDNSCISGLGGTSDEGGPDTIINGYMTESVTTHELGRTLGLLGAGGLHCLSSTGTPVPLSSNCTIGPDDDPWDNMANAHFQLLGSTVDASPLFGSPNRDTLGWMAGRDQTVTTSGTYTLEPIELQDGGLHSLRIPLGRKVFWLEYRQPIGSDSFMSGQSPCVDDGVQIRMADSLQSQAPLLLDMQAAQNDPTYFLCSALPATKTWTDPTGVLTITDDTATPSGTQVTITLTGDRIAPSVPTQLIRPIVGTTVQTSAGDTSVTVRDDRAATDTGGSGLCGYDTQFGTQNWDQNPPQLATSVQVTIQSVIPLGHEQNTFRTAAFDCNQNMSAWSTTETPKIHGYQESAFTLTGKWVRKNAKAYWGGWQDETTQKNARATLKFTGTAVGLVNFTGAGRGAFKVALDGKYQTTINTGTPSGKYAAITYSHAWATSGAHTITLTALGTTKRPAVDLDGAVVLQ